MTDIADRLAKLTPQQRALLDRRLRERGGAAPSEQPIAPRGHGRPSPLTVDQERIWLIHQFDSDDPAYNVFFAWRLRGDLRLDALRWALGALVARHEALRTTFRLDGLRPVQVVHDELAYEYREFDLTDEPAEAREQRMWELGAGEVRRPFDIVAGPLVRISVLRLAADHTVMIATIDHLVWDRRSLGVFGAEVAEFYNAKLAGREPELGALPVQYADYAEWQPRWVDERIKAREVPYWRERLGGASMVLELPADRPRPPVQTFNGARYEFHLPVALTEAIRELARREGTTVYVVVLAAWQLLLHRLTGQQDIIVGTTSSTRSRSELEALIGYFLTMLPLRTVIRPEMTFRELLHSVRRTVVDAFDHKDIPFGTLLDELDVDRDPSRNPVYQTSFMFVDFHEDPVPLSGLRLEALIFDNHTAKDECMLCVFDDAVLADHLFGLFEYNTDLFDTETIARLARYLRRLLEQGVTDAGRPVGRLSLADDAELATMLTAWNSTAVPREAGLTLDGLIRRQAAASPAAVAVSSGDERITYAELVERAGALATYLRGRGAGPERVVGVCLERSVDLVVGLLGVLMSGAAYLPLDPGHPPQRLATMCADAGAMALLTEAELRPVLAECAGEVVCLDLDRDAIAACGPLGAGPARSDERLAYVIYTSGSTGRPKGVEVTHRNLVNLVLGMADEIELTASDVLAAVTSVSFDIAGLELYTPLARGAEVVVVPRAVGQDGAALRDLLTDRGATVVQATPATWHLLTGSGWRNTGALRVLVGGEALPPVLAGVLADGPAPVWNVYGPTETTIWSTCWPVEPGAGQISIGRPIANTEVYVLDEHLEPVSAGLPGELYIGGAGVARGYHDRPGLTAGRFVPDHLSGRPGARLYRTGDQVRYRPDGTLLFLGRDDGQVKLRGYRIELGEIETRLAEHPEVARAVAMVREDRPGDRRLVAYVQPSGEAFRPEDLREHLRAFVPDYMVPAALVAMSDFPLTTSGKIDRRALPPPPAERQGAGFVAPRDPVELAVAAIWEDVLGTRPVGLHDRFFDLGGHSLLVLKLMTEIESRFGRQLPMAAIFQGATVERFAHLLRDGYAPEQEAHLVEIRYGTAGRPIFFAHPAGSEVVCYMPFARLTEPLHRPMYAIAPPPLVDGELPYATFEQRAAAYVELIRRQQPAGPYTVAGWCYGGVNAFAIAAELESQGEQVELTLFDSHPPVYVTADEEPDRSDIVAALAQNLQWDYGDGLLGLDQLREMTDDEHLDYLLDIARKGDYLPPDAGRDRMALVLDLWVANLHLVWKYRPRPLATPYTLVLARDEDPALYARWNELAGGGLTVRTVDGNHYTMMREPLVAAVAAVLNEPREDA
ncbi:amino acid adenylation domain-containing protein [Micromonospora sp. DT228]|uniref:amino acid adenylation domain-containing protein n=1 Tax=Micromonospora sp. DT228 TaxID=3393443 RepID=UPI003CEE130F